MASNDDDYTPISSPIPGPPQHETPIGSVQSPTPSVYPPLSQTTSIIPPPSMPPPSTPPPRPQNPALTGVTEQKQPSSWDPSMLHAQQHSPYLNHQGMPSASTPFMPPRSSLNGFFPDTPVDDVGEIGNRNASATWGPANSLVSPEGKAVRFDSALLSHPISTEQNRHSWHPSTPYAYQDRPDLYDQGTQSRLNTPFIPSLNSSRGPSFDTPNHRAGVSVDYHNDGWSAAKYSAPGSPGVDHHRTQSFAGAALRYDGIQPSASWNPATYPVPRPPANDRDWIAPSGAGAALRYDGVPNAGTTWQAATTPWVGMATRDDEALTPTHPITTPTLMHATTNPTSTHPITNPSWAVHVYSQTLQITGERLRRYQIVRSKLRFESQLNDLFSGSLVPLTQQHPPLDIEKIMEQATMFFSSFRPDAHWHMNVENLPHRVGKVIDGLTPNSRNFDVGFRFMRFRFPYVKFEWFLQTSYCEIYTKMDLESTKFQPTEVEVLWKAWARAGAASGLVAYGSIKDTIQIFVTGPNQWDRVMLITNRHFIVTQVFQPELMTPVPYHRALPPLSQNEDVMIFSTSWTVIQFLRSSQIRMGFLIALSALFAALQPIVGKYTSAGAWILAVFGVLSGLVSVVAVSFGWLLTRIEAQAAKKRQAIVDK